MPGSDVAAFSSTGLYVGVNAGSGCSKKALSCSACSSLPGTRETFQAPVLAFSVHCMTLERWGRIV